VRCHVTIEGSLHSAAISKTSGLLVGYMRSGIAPVETCRGTEGARPSGLDESLPWHLRYDSFAGTLPRITSIKFRVIGASFLLTIFGVSCLYRTTAESPGLVIASLNAEGNVTAVRADETASIPKSSGSVLCPSSGTASGSGTMSVVGAQNGMTVRLI
jgi:hypothetical protein